MRLKIGIVGCGVVATAYYLPHMLRNANKYQVVAVCDNNERRAKACAKLFGVPQVFSDYNQMIREADIEAVFILTGPGTHAPFALAAVESGRHLLLQKPMALNLADAERITQAVRKSKVVAVIEPSDHSPIDWRYDQVRSLVADGLLGDPYWFTLCPTGPDHEHVSLSGNPYGIGAFYSKDSGGFLFDYPYGPNQIATVLGSFKSVQGLAKVSIPNRAVVPDERYDEFLEACTDPMDANYWRVVVHLPRTQAVEMAAPDNVFSMYEMENGWIGMFHVGRLCVPVPKGLPGGGLQIWGTEGNLVFGHGGHFASWKSRKKEGSGADGWHHIDQNLDWSRSEWPIPTPGDFNYYEASTDHLYDCILNGKDPVVNVEWGRHITEVMAGALQSAEDGKRYEMTTSLTGLRA